MIKLKELLNEYYNSTIDIETRTPTKRARLVRYSLTDFSRRNRSKKLKETDFNTISKTVLNIL